MNRSIRAAAGALIAGALLAPLAAQESKPALRLTPPPPQQEKSQEELKELREKKLAKPVFQKADWMFDYDAARERARKEGKLILTYFTRSYAP